MRESAIEAKLHIAAAFWPTQPDSGRKCPNYVIAANSCLCECPGMYTLPKPQSASQHEVTPRRIAMLCFENAQGIDVTGPLSVFT